LEQGIEMTNPLYDTDADAKWDVNPADWRNLPDSDLTDDDQDVPTPKHVKDVLGFDPDEEDWE